MCTKERILGLWLVITIFYFLISGVAQYIWLLTTLGTLLATDYIEWRDEKEATKVKAHYEAKIKTLEDRIKKLEDN